MLPLWGAGPAAANSITQELLPGPSPHRSEPPFPSAAAGRRETTQLVCVSVNVQAEALFKTSLLPLTPPSVLTCGNLTSPC